MKMQSSDELPLIERKSSISPNVYAKGTEYAVCLLVALPTAVLNGLAAISGDAEKANELHTPDNLRDLLSKAGTTRVVYGVIALTASEAVLFFLNKRYLLASGKAAVDLVRRTLLTLRHTCAHSEVRERDRAGFGENGLLLWSLMTSLIFAEMGRKALSFLGVAGEVVGFSLSLSVYFATRFAGARMFFINMADANWRLKQKYAFKLELLKSGNVTLRVDIPPEERDLNRAVMRFLVKLDANWEKLPKDRQHVIWLRYIAPIMGYTLVAMTALPILSGLLPESVQGAETLTHSNIGANNHYQNASSFSFGTFATALTLFFYELNIKDLPKHFLRTALSIYEKTNNRDIAGAIKLFGQTLLALGASYLTGIGFKFVADTALSNGYLSYLGDWLSSAIPDGLFTATITMLWSHLQELINQTEQKIIVDGAEIDFIDTTNVQTLLGRPEIDISALRGNRYAMFYDDVKETVSNPSIEQEQPDSHPSVDDEITVLSML